MVRDDFWLAVSRFLAELEVRLIEAENTRMVDLFDARHARKVLTLFRRAYGRLPEDAASLTPEHEAFLDQAVACPNPKPGHRIFRRVRRFEPRRSAGGRSACRFCDPAEVPFGGRLVRGQV